MEGDGGSCDENLLGKLKDAKAITGCCTEHLPT